jgi:hypothetical protein
MTSEHDPVSKATTKTKSAFVTFDDILPRIDGAHQSGDPVRQSALGEVASIAAATLGSLPKGKPKRWTGWIGKDHFWRGRRVVLRNGIVAEVFGVLRGQAAVRWADPQWIEGVRRDVVSLDELTIYKHPAAVVLGKLKCGCKERPSERKHRACRSNGARPLRSGHRPRGRPRKGQQVATASASGLDSGDHHCDPVARRDANIVLGRVT